METLELKHLAPYLPYKLRIMYGKRNCVMVMLTDSSNHWISIHSVINRQWNDKYPLRPILRPLSDLTKEIEGVNGINFIPIKMLLIMFKPKSFDIEIKETDKYWEANYKSWIAPFLRIDKNILNNKHWIIEKLFEWHFDVFGLIEKDLAININTI